MLFPQYIKITAHILFSVRFPGYRSPSNIESTVKFKQILYFKVNTYTKFSQLEHLAWKTRNTRDSANLLTVPSTKLVSSDVYDGRF